MKGVELICAGACAAAVHAALLVGWRTPDLGTTEGSAGTAMAMVAPTPDLVALVEAWDSAPSTASEVSPPVAPVASPAPVAPPRATDTAPDRTYATRAAMPAMDATPFAQTTPLQHPAPTTQVAQPVVPEWSAPRLPMQPEAAPQIAALAPLRAPGASEAAPAPPEPPAAAPPVHAPKTSKRPVLRPSSTAPKATAQRRPAATQKAPKQGQAQTAARGAPKGISPTAMQQWQSRVRRSVQRTQRYPRGTRAEGVVRVALTLGANGALQGARIVASSGHARLDDAALRAVRNARYPKAPEGADKSRYSFVLPLSFQR